MDNPGYEQILLREVETLRQREHPNIVPLLASYILETMGSAVPVTTLHLIEPLADKDLYDWMISSQPPAWLEGLPELERRAYLYRFIYALVSGLSFLHREKDGTITAHHDLKPRNILVIGQELCIADFGRSHLHPSAKGSETEATSGLGTYEYQPPEYWKEDGYRANVEHGRSFDVWSMGCIIIEIAILILYGWKDEKVTEFRNERRHNPKKGRPMLADRHTPDDSFHNNWVVVEEWIRKLQEKGTLKLKSTLDVALQMMTQSRGSRLYAWEAEMDLYNIQQPDYDRVKRLEKGALCVQPPPLSRKILNGTQTPLHRAARKGDREMLVKLYETGWSLYVQDHEGLTAIDVINQSPNAYSRNVLHECLAPRRPERATDESQGWELLQAATRGQVHVVRDLLDHGVDARVVDNKGHSALYKAVEHRHSSVARCLLRARGKDLLRQKDIAWGDTPLHKAASLGHTTIIQQLLQYGPDIEDQQKEGKTALFVAADSGHEEVVDVLLHHGAQTFTQRDMKGTPLHAAVKWRKVLQRLLKAHDASKCLEHKNKFGDTPLWLAVFNNHLECAQILLDAGASLHVANNDEMSVLHVAVTKGLYDFLEKNIRQFRRDDIEFRNRRNYTPLMTAGKEGDLRIVGLLTRRLDRA